MTSHQLECLVWYSLALLVGAAVFQGLWQAQNRARVGQVILRRSRRRRLRWLLCLAAVASAGAVILLEPLGRTPACLGLLALSIWLVASSPGFQDSIWGEQGVQRGWYARRFRELEQWRLVGEHLRWRVFGNWVSTEVPSSEHARLRVVLEAQAPGRESPHGNAGFDVQRAALTKSKS